MYLVPLFKCNAIVFTLHLRGGVKGIRVISYSLGFGVCLMYSLYMPKGPLSILSHSSRSISFRYRLYKPNQLSGTRRMGQYHGKKETGHLIVYIVTFKKEPVIQESMVKFSSNV